MPSPSPHLLLEVARRIDFDPTFHREVAQDPLVALTRAGLDTATSVALVADDEVQLFAATPSRIASRAHRWAMALLREAG